MERIDSRQGLEMETLDSMRGLGIETCDSRRERKKQETRQRLLRSAWRLFREKGYDDTTVEEITEAADVGKGTFFNYFATKESIVDEIALWRIDLVGNEVLGADDVPASAVARVKLLMTTMADELAPRHDLTYHMVLARIRPPIRRESAHRIGSLIQELVVQGQANGEIRDDVDPHFASHLLMTCLFHHLRHWWHHKGDYPEEAALIRSVDVLMSGLNGKERRAT
jgi:AcrR family transcriptional regulator